ncbi:FAD-binding protein [Gordonia terrae]|uniref:FAD-binding protein n=1 Tax=Gordonia terrae TaxID=2055 RepID=A0A2I1RC05_9ACTN|nr:FAD-binding oxidoreductase [Gordonia terrae]PKZ66687.1 FAD-binding protein [Gordonia terrae]
MTTLSDGIAAELDAALAGRVHRPGSAGYRESLSRIFFPDASRRTPPCVVHPRDTSDVATAMRIVSAGGGRVTARGGGLSSTCVDDSAVLMDLSVHLTRIDAHDDRVRVQGGATVGAALEALTGSGRVIPVGIVGLAGFGLVTRGGVGYLTRSAGLTVDHLVEVELVRPDGEVVRLDADSTGTEADLWWAVRGCAPSFGVVTAAVLRTVAQGPVHIDRAVVELDALADYFAIAPTLPRHTTMGAVLGYGADDDEPALLVYTACRGSRATDLAEAREATDAVVAGSARPPRFRSQTTGRYLSGLPEFAHPGPGGTDPPPIRAPGPDTSSERGHFFGKSVFVGPTLGDDVADGLRNAITAAPTRACRIDFQHTGGALADVDDASTAFWGRGAEWNVPLNAIWSDDAATDRCEAWARAALDVLAADTIGVYSVELRPGFAETERETEAAFGGNLARLRRLRDHIDPGRALGVLPL